MKTDLAIITKEDLSLSGENNLNEKQLNILLKSTPKQYVKQRPAKGGGQWDYVTGGYVRKVLNLMFGWDWDFEIVSHTVEYGEVVVLGRLTCRSNGHTIVKTQFGNKEIVTKKGSNQPLSIGNDMKAAATDALKKCASEIGIASDIYNKEDFRETIISEPSDVLKRLENLYELKRDKISEEDREFIERVIAEQDESSYKKCITELVKI